MHKDIAEDKKEAISERGQRPLSHASQEISPSTLGTS